MSEELFSGIDQFEAMSVAHDVLDYLLGAEPELAQLALERWVLEAAVLERPARAADAALRLLQEFGPAAWPQIAELMKTDTELMRAAFSAPRLAYDRRVPALTEAQLAELWLWLENEFPTSGDPQFDDAHFVGPRETIGRFRDDVLERLRTTPTDAAGVPSAR